MHISELPSVHPELQRQSTHWAEGRFEVLALRLASNEHAIVATLKDTNVKHRAALRNKSHLCRFHQPTPATIHNANSTTLHAQEAFLGPRSNWLAMLSCAELAIPKGQLSLL